MALASFIKDPDATREITIDYFTDGFLGSKTISSATWIVPAGLVKESESNTTTVSSVIISGGRLNDEIEIVNRITFGPSTPAEVTDRTIRVVIKQK